VALTAGRPRRKQNRKVTDEERAEWRERNEAGRKEQEGRAMQARLDLAAAREDRDRAQRAVDTALLAALEVNKAEALCPLMGVSEATFWRTVKRLRER
jgi:hypothetical protein